MKTAQASAFVGVVGLLSLLPNVAMAVEPDHVLEQVIQPIVCTSTTTNSGPSVTVASTCDESYAPTLTQIIIDENRLILRGKYDTAHAKTFRVQLAGRWYEWVSQYLTTREGDWQLNLSDLRREFAPGTYDVVLEVVTHSGLYFYDTIRNELVIAVPQESPREKREDDNEKATPLALGNSGGTLAMTGQATAAIIGAAILLIVTALLLLLKRRKN